MNIKRIIIPLILTILLASTITFGSNIPLGPYFDDTYFDLSDSTLILKIVPHEKGGLEADVSAYDGLIKITGGATSNLTIGIGDDNIVEMDDADAAVDDYCKLTANGIGGRSYTEVKTDLGIDLSLYYLKTEIDTLSELETIYTKDIIDSDELATLKFTDLTDTPANYTGNSFKFARVNAGETTLEFAAEADPTVDTDAEIKAILVDEVTKTGDFTAGRIAKINNATGIIEQGTNTDTDVADAVTKKHTQNTDTVLILTNALASDHTYSGLTDSQQVGESVVFGDLLYFDWTAVEWKKAIASAYATTPAERISLETKADGETCLMLVKGYIRDDSAFDFGASAIFLNDDTAGTCDDTAPAESGDQIQVVGTAKSADILFFNPSQDVGEI